MVGKTLKNIGAVAVILAFAGIMLYALFYTAQDFFKQEDFWAYATAIGGFVLFAVGIMAGQKAERTKRGEPIQKL